MGPEAADQGDLISFCHVCTHFVKSPNFKRQRNTYCVYSHFFYALSYIMYKKKVHCSMASVNNETWNIPADFQQPE